MNGKEALDETLVEQANQKKAVKKQPSAKKSKAAQKPKAKKQTKGKQVQPAKAEKSKRAFPNVGLEDALKVAQVIKSKNNGHPWDTELVATACGTTRTAKKFFYLAAAARDYGLTSGSRDTSQISLTDLGRALIYAQSAEVERRRRLKPFSK